MNFTKVDQSCRIKSVLPYEVQFQFGYGRFSKSNVTRLRNVERFWNEKLVGKLTCHNKDVFRYDDDDEDEDEPRYAYAVQFCPQKVISFNQID